MSQTVAERAAKLGLGDPSLWPGGEIDVHISVQSIDQLRDLLDSGADEAKRASHVAAMFQGIDPAGAPDGGLLRRVYHYVYGNDPLSAEDRAAMEPAFPMKVRVFMADDITKDTQWDLGTSDKPVSVTVGTLTLNQGGYVSIQNTSLDFTVDNLIRNGDPGPDIQGDFLILGVRGGKGGDGITPKAPGQAQNGSVGVCFSPGVSGDGGGSGTTGTFGTEGGTGEDGEKGLPSLHATITIKKTVGGTASNIIIATQCGPGGDGGKGGDGSPGGQGGNGGDGVTCGCTSNTGGTGAQGGKGGTGGSGGKGGKGGDATENITVNVPAAYKSAITKFEMRTPGGDGGRVGQPGPGGAGGTGGTGGKGNASGSSGDFGGTGDPGKPGARGDDGTTATITITPT